MSTPFESVPAGLLHASQKVFDLYTKYERIRELTFHLNGLPDSAPLPDHVKIRDIAVAYTVNGLVGVAEIASTELRVGDLYRLFSKELENLVAEIRTHAAEARLLATSVEQTCTKAQYNANAQQVRGDM
jgi:hypothetical protein